MPLENLVGPDKFLDALNRLWPLGTDEKLEGDDHIRGVKNVTLNSFPTVAEARYPASFILPPGGESEEKAGALEVAVGTDAQRPETPTTGALRWNNDQNVLEQYKAGSWSPVDPTKSAGDMIAAGAGGVLEAVTPDAVGQVPMWGGSSVGYDWPVARGYIDGCITKNGDSSSQKKVGLGVFRNEADTKGIRITAEYQKESIFPWAEGDNAGGFLPAGVPQPDTSYHYVVFTADDDGRVDWGFDSDPKGANVPSGWTFERRVASIMTKSNATFPAMNQRGDLFQFNDGADVQRTIFTSAPTAAVALGQVLGLPLGVELEVNGSVMAGQGNASTWGTYFQSYWMTTPSQYKLYLSINAGTFSSAYGYVSKAVSNDQAQVMVGREAGDNNPEFFLEGWVDQRGKDAA